jgi:hypothetical protein
MIPYSNTTPQSWSEFAAWLRGLKLDDIHIEHNAERDEVIIRNSKTMTVQRVSRFALEHMDPALRQEIFLQTIANTMAYHTPTATEIIKEQMYESFEKAAADALNRATMGPAVTQAIYTGSTPGAVGSGILTAGGGGGALGLGTYSISSGGNGGVGFGNAVRGAIGAPMYVDEYYSQQKEQAELAKKLFSTNEQALFQSMKRHIWDAWQGKRVIEENQLWNRDRMVIAGGCFTSMITGGPIKDYDVFLLDDDHNRSIMEYMVSKYGDRDDVRVGGSNYMDNKQIEQTIFFKKSKFQYITTKYKTREELIEHFDFKHCRVSYDLMTEKLFITRETMDLILKMELDPSRPDDLPKPWRYEKFRERGWRERGYQDNERLELNLSEFDSL